MLTELAWWVGFEPTSEAAMGLPISLSLRSKACSSMTTTRACIRSAARKCMLVGSVGLPNGNYGRAHRRRACARRSPCISDPPFVPWLAARAAATIDVSVADDA